MRPADPTHPRSARHQMSQPCRRGRSPRRHRPPPPVTHAPASATPPGSPASDQVQQTCRCTTSQQFDRKGPVSVRRHRLQSCPVSRPRPTAPPRSRPAPSTSPAARQRSRHGFDQPPRMPARQPRFGPARHRPGGAAAQPAPPSSIRTRRPDRPPRRTSRALRMLPEATVPRHRADGQRLRTTQERTPPTLTTALSAESCTIRSRPGVANRTGEAVAEDTAFQAILDTTISPFGLVTRRDGTGRVERSQPGPRQASGPSVHAGWAADHGHGPGACARMCR